MDPFKCNIFWNGQTKFAGNYCISGAALTNQGLANQLAMTCAAQKACDNLKKLGENAALFCIEEQGGPRSDTTHTGRIWGQVIYGQRMTNPNAQ